MLIPIGTTVQHRRQPFVTYFIIGLNLLIFASQWAISRSGGVQSESEIIRFIANLESDGQLSSVNFHFLSLLTYQFLHAGWMHILINMIFLLPFGKAVEDRMGHIGFALFYLGCGALGGYIHTVLYSNPVVGASGSVCAVVAAFIVLAPKTKIHVLVIFFIIGVYAVPSLLLVGFFVALDTFSLLASLVGTNASPTAWVVHLVGYLTGFIITFLALTLGFIRSSEFDLTLMIRQHLRKREMNKYVNSAPVFNHEKPQVESPESLKRMSIADETNRGNIGEATDQYFEAIKAYPSFKIDRRTHHVIGSTLLQDDRTAEGVEVFERYLKQHKDAKDCPEVALLLAAKYTRRLDNSKRAKELLKKHANEFSEEHQQLARTIELELTT
jgi:membrane associated rhomboid family serine protease